MTELLRYLNATLDEIETDLADKEARKAGSVTPYDFAKIQSLRDRRLLVSCIIRKAKG